MGPQQRLLLALLAPGETHGAALQVAASSVIAPRSVYVLLSRLKAAGLVTSRPEPRPDGADGPQRVLWQLTPAGREELAWARKVEQALAPLVARRRKRPAAV